jgi:hypothetical protein
MGETKREQKAGDISRTTGNLNSIILAFVLWGVTIPFTLLAVFGEWSKEKEVEESPSDFEEQTVVVD